MAFVTKINEFIKENNVAEANSQIDQPKVYETRKVRDKNIKHKHGELEVLVTSHPKAR